MDNQEIYEKMRKLLKRLGNKKGVTIVDKGTSVKKNYQLKISNLPFNEKLDLNYKIEESLKYFLDSSKLSQDNVDVELTENGNLSIGFMFVGYPFTDMTLKDYEDNFNRASTGEINDTIDAINRVLMVLSLMDGFIYQ